MDLTRQILELLILAIPIACIARTVVFEDLFAEARDWCRQRSQQCQRFTSRKFFYLFTCEYCFSFYVTTLLLLITRYQMLYPDWRGYLVSGFSLVWIANIYMSLFFLIRTDLKNDGLDSKIKESELKKCEQLTETIHTNIQS